MMELMENNPKTPSFWNRCLGLFLRMSPQWLINLATRCLNHIYDRSEVWLRVAMTWAGPVFVLIAVVLIGIITYIQVELVVPLITDGNLTSVTAIVHYIISVGLSGNIYFNYIMCIKTPPGAPPQIKVDTETMDHLKRDNNPEGIPVHKFCKRCKQVKPPRSHHCPICDKCVLRMDHHCPWICNCVGHFNHKYFVLFMLYLFLGCGYCALMAFPSFLESIDFNSTIALERGPILFQFILCVAVMIAVGMLLGWHIYLSLTNQTTVEFYNNLELNKLAKTRGNVFVNIYDLGWQRNFSLFYGTKQSMLSFLLPSFAPTPGDGVNFEKRRLGVHNV